MLPIALLSGTWGHLCLKGGDGYLSLAVRGEPFLTPSWSLLHRTADWTPGGSL
jgi:hypothetical protein